MQLYALGRFSEIHLEIRVVSAFGTLYFCFILSKYCKYLKQKCYVIANIYYVGCLQVDLICAEHVQTIFLISIISYITQYNNYLIHKEIIMHL